MERPQTRRYRFAADAGAASTRDDFGNYILKKGVGQCYKPAYGLRVKNGQTLDGVTAVSYTHLTLPTNREV